MAASDRFASRPGGPLAMMRPVSLVAAAALAGAAASCGEAETATRGFYEGKKLEVIVPFGPGGGSDAWARLIAPRLQQRLGSRTAVQILNIPGATSVAGVNEFALRRKPDGRAAVVTAGSTIMPYLLGEPAVRYDFRDFAPIVLSPVGGVVFVSPSLRVKTAADLPRAAEPLVYGGISATGGDLLPLLAFELLGLRVKTILGYSTKGASRVAFEQGETNIEYQTMPSYLTQAVPLVEAGRAMPVFSWGVLNDSGEVVRDPSVPDLPSVREVYTMIFGREPAGPEWDAYKLVLLAASTMQKVLWVHADAPPEAIAALRGAADGVVHDPEFLEAARAEVGVYPFYVGEAAGRVVATVLESSPQTLRWIKDFLRTRHGVERL